MLPTRHYHSYRIGAGASSCRRSLCQTRSWRLHCELVRFFLFVGLHTVQRWLMTFRERGQAAALSVEEANEKLVHRGALRDVRYCAWRTVLVPNSHLVEACALAGVICCSVLFMTMHSFMWTPRFHVLSENWPRWCTHLRLNIDVNWYCEGNCFVCVQVEHHNLRHRVGEAPTAFTVSSTVVRDSECLCRCLTLMVFVCLSMPVCSCSDILLISSLFTLYFCTGRVAF